MTTEQKKQVKRLQDNLFAIRKLAGWTADDLGKMLDVTKQTIYNLERGKPKMSLIQYLAIRALIDDEIQRQPENEALKSAAIVLLDDDEITEKNLEELQKSLKVITNGMTKKADKDIVKKLALGAVNTFASAASIAALASLPASAIVKGTATGFYSWLNIVRDQKEGK